MNLWETPLTRQHTQHYGPPLDNDNIIWITGTAAVTVTGRREQSDWVASGQAEEGVWTEQYLD